MSSEWRNEGGCVLQQWWHMWFESFISCRLIVKVYGYKWQQRAKLIKYTKTNRETQEVRKNIRVRLTTEYAYFEDQDVCSGCPITILQLQNKGTKNKHRLKGKKKKKCKEG